MTRSFARIGLIVLLVAALPYRSPAPLIYRPGEGWTYELPGAKSDWHRMRAKDQLDLAQDYFDKKKFKMALKSAQRVVRVWPFSDYAPKGEYLVGRCYEELKQDENAFDAYETYLDKYRKSANVEDVQQRQFAIALRFLHGQWFKLWGHIPFFPSMSRTAEMFDKIVNFGPYGPLGPQSQMNIGVARDKEKDYPLSVKAYELAADRYSEQTKLASDALYNAALEYNKQARKADYDQSIAGKAISAFTDFMALYPDDPRVADAQRLIGSLRAVQAQGDFRVAQFYEKEKRWDGARVYYNEVLIRDAGSPLAILARQRIDFLRRRMASK
jgi:outer membrane protein assembly factor BamD